MSRMTSSSIPSPFDATVGTIGGGCYDEDVPLSAFGRAVVAAVLGLLAALDEIARQLRLAIDHDALATGQIEEIDAMVAAVERKGETVMRKTFPMQALADAGAIHKANGAFFEHPGPHARQNVFLADAVDDHIVDTRIGEKLAEQEAGRT